MSVESEKPQYGEWWAASESQNPHFVMERTWSEPEPVYIAACKTFFLPGFRCDDRLPLTLRCTGCVDVVLSWHIPDDCDDASCQWCELLSDRRRVARLTA